MTIEKALGVTVPIYELFATGDSLNGYRFRMRSLEVYMDKRLAEEAIPAFVGRCCDKSQFECAERETLKVQVVERALVVTNKN